MRYGALALVAVIAGMFAADWKPQTNPITAELRGLSVVDSGVVWASGRFGQLVRTTDGGQSWHALKVAGADSLDFRDVFAFDAQQAFAMSAGEAERGQAKIFRTSDGGATWTLAYATDQKGVFLDAIAFWNRDRGMVMSDPVDGAWFLLRTIDGGRSWAQVPNAALPRMLEGEAAFAASGTTLALHGTRYAWIASGGAARARVFRSTDGGVTWAVAETPVHSGGGTAGIFSIAFADSVNGVVVGGDYSKPRESFPNVALTSDGGRSWRLARGPTPPGYMSSVAYVPGTRGRTLVAVGLAGTAVSSDAGESWTMVDTLPYNSVSFASRVTGWAVGPRGRIARWEGTVGAGLPVRKQTQTRR